LPFSYPTEIHMERALNRNPALSRERLPRTRL
jgi:hypothetical protein